MQGSTYGITHLIAAASRQITVFKRRNSRLRLLVPRILLEPLNLVHWHLQRIRMGFIPVEHQSAYVNLYQCCVQKTGSQWIKSLLSDVMTYRFSGLPYHPVRGNGFHPLCRIPPRTIAGPLYITFSQFSSIPKNGPYRVLFILRDPRDIIVSWYFSTKSTHVAAGENLLKRRRILQERSLHDGLIYAIDFLEQDGRFASMLSWVEGSKKDPGVILARYEDIRRSDPQAFREIFNRMDIRIPDRILEETVLAYSFKRLSGRNSGKESTRSHLRKGGAGDWKNYFDGKTEARFHEVTGDMLERLGYRQ